MRRFLLSTATAGLLGLAIWRIPTIRAGQGAVSWSKPGHEDLTFWVNHNGLEQIDVEGELGFGDAARILMRRRLNAAATRKLRDRFVFKTREFGQLPADTGTSYVIAQNRVFNLIDATGRADRVLESQAGKVTRTIAGRAVTFDVRPLHRLKVNLSEPARVYITGADGLGYAPKGSISRFASEPAEQFFHAQGSFEIDLPAGQTAIEATRGIEYTLTTQTLDLRKPTEITLRLRRWTDMAQRGWFSSDAHIHANYTAPHHQVVTPEDVLAYTLGEDLHLPNLMVANSSGAFLHDTKYFEGKPHALSRPPYLLYWNEEMRNSGLYGHMCLYGLKKLVEPLYTGFRDTPHWEDYPPNFAQAKATRAQGGAVTYAHPGYATAFDGFSAREFPVDAALGEIDALDVMSNNPEEIAMENWYRLLNCGLKVGISAGSDSFTNVADHYTPGGHRVYAHVPGGLRYEGWIASYKAGRTYASNGPMIFLSVDGHEPGSEIRLPGAATVKAKIEVQSHVPVEKIELIVNGKPQAVQSGKMVSLPIDRSAWIAARATGPWHRLILNDGYAFAHTSPVYVLVGGKPIWSTEDAQFWTSWIDKLIERTQQRGRFATEDRRREVVELFAKARQYFMK